MSRDGFYSQQDGTVIEKTFADANDDLKAVLKDLFETPVLTAEIALDGKISRLQINPGKQKKEAIEEPANFCLFFAEPFNSETDEWTVSRKIPGITGSTTTGVLTFKREGQHQSDEQSRAMARVKVSADFSFDDLNNPDFQIKNSKCRVTGFLEYDQSAHSYVGGSVKIEGHVEQYIMGELVLKSTGTTTATLTTK